MSEFGILVFLLANEGIGGPCIGFVFLAFFEPSFSFAVVPVECVA